MYIWRSKNRRDKRNLLLLGEVGWTVSAEDAISPIAEDELLRNEKEKEFVQYFTKRIVNLMETYLETNDGLKEVDLVRRELERFRRLSAGPASAAFGMNITEFSISLCVPNLINDCYSA